VTRAGDPEAERRIQKSAAAFRTTGEAAEEVDVPAHVLRFWESKFPQIRPLKRGGGRRYYRPEDIDLLRRIRQYLYQEGYTIRGVQRLLRETAGHRRISGSAAAEEEPPQTLFALPSTDGSAPVDGSAPIGGAGPSEASRPSREALRAALDEVRQELLKIRTLLDELMR
jgi:DNA-binding transcriptional MerR regulator